MAIRVMTQDGLVSAAVTFGGAAIQVGDTVDLNGFTLTLDGVVDLGANDTTPVIFSNGSDPLDQGGLIFQANSDVTLRGGVDVGASTVTVEAGAHMKMVSSPATGASISFAWADSGPSSKALTVNGTPENPARFEAQGTQPVILGDVTRFNASFIAENFEVDGFGGNDGAGNITRSAFELGVTDGSVKALNVKFDNVKGPVSIYAHGGQSMGDIQIDGLYVINPDPASGFTDQTVLFNFDGALDETIDYSPINLRVLQNVRCHGSAQLRFLGRYTIAGHGYEGRAEIIPSTSSAPSKQNDWITGNHNGNFVKPLCSVNNWYMRDTAAGARGAALSSIRLPGEVSINGVVWDPQNTGVGSLSYMFATEATDPTAHFTSAGQVIVLENFFKIRNPAATDAFSGTIVLTLSGELDPAAPGSGVGNKPQFRVKNGVALMVQGGRFLNANVDGVTPTNVVIEETGNIWYDPDNTASSVHTASIGDSPVDDIVDATNSDYNARFGIPTNGLPVTGAYGTNLIVDVNPQFLDEDRSLTKWAVVKGDTEQSALRKIIAAGASGEADPAEYNVASLCAYIQDGFVPLAPSYLTASQTGGRLGSTLGATPVDITSINGAVPITEGGAAYLEFATDVVVTSVRTIDYLNNSVSHTITGQSLPNRVEFTFNKEGQRLGEVSLVCETE